MQSVLYSTRKPMLSLTEDPLYPDYIADISRENPVEAENVFSESTGYTDVCAVAFSPTLAVTADCDIGFDIPYNRLQFWCRDASKIGSLTLEHSVNCGDRGVKYIRACLEFDIFIVVDEKGVICTWERNEKKKWYKSNEIHWMNVPILHLSGVRKSHFASIHDVRFSRNTITQENEGVMVLWRVEPKGTLKRVHIHQGDGKINTVEWANLDTAELLVLSTKSCGVICTWERNEKKKWYKSNEIHWMNVPILHLSGVRKSHFASIHDVRFSRNTITQENEGVMVLWRVEPKGILKRVHIHQGDGKINTVEWANSDTAELLVLSTKSCVYAFDICTLTPLWVACEPNLKLAVTSQFTVAYNANVISIVDCNSGTLLCHKEMNLPVGNVAAIGKDEMFCVVAANQKQSQKQFAVRSTATKTPFSKLITVGDANDKNIEIPMETAPNIDLLSGPAYSLAPIPYLAQRFIRSCFLPPRRL
ncbi:unnamed protein product [Gongylonema pulchrum]|uniref:WD_REPEATS_REGION domain-containing protein n=1 Tax=Gongylonema pulchrum TaxID=637853 RepID=A0A183EH80_9BILA|nr:unnamed protein product [Gongylonema pulchrum]